jgi:hypothetical protein
MIARLTQEELDYIDQMVCDRIAIKTHNKRVSNMSDHRVLFMGLAGELAAAKALGCLCDLTAYVGGDRHVGDLRRGPYTIELKTRHKHLPADFMFPYGQDPIRFPNDFGLLGRWEVDYSVLELIGWFSAEDYTTKKQTIEVSGVREGVPTQRWGMVYGNLRPMSGLVRILNEVEAETLHTPETQGRHRSIGNGSSSGGSGVLIGELCPQLAHFGY